MSSRTRKIAGIAAGAIVGAAALGYAAHRAIRGIRSRRDPDAGTLGPLVFDEARRLPSHDGGSLYTVSRGSGPPIVFLHGVTITSQVWVKQFATLPSAGVRVVALDHRGHGESTVGDTGHSVANLAADVRTVLEALDLSDVILVGHSMGGLAVEAFAVQHPEVAAARVRGLVLASTFARTYIGGVGPFGFVAEQVTGRSPAMNGLMTRPDLGLLLARMGFGREPLPSHVELTRSMLAACPPETQRAAVKAIVNADLTDELSSITLPTLVLCGTADALTPPREARRIASLIPGARLELFAGAGHMLMLERTERFDELLLEFARDVGALEAIPKSA